MATGQPGDPSADPSKEEPWYTAMASVIVAGLGLLVLFGSVAFGVIGTFVGAYFGVRAANRAVDKMGKKAA